MRLHASTKGARLQATRESGPVAELKFFKREAGELHEALTGIGSGG